MILVHVHVHIEYVYTQSHMYCSGDQNIRKHANLENLLKHAGHSLAIDALSYYAGMA